MTPTETDLAITKIYTNLWLRIAKWVGLTLALFLVVALLVYVGSAAKGEVTPEKRLAYLVSYGAILLPMFMGVVVSKWGDPAVTVSDTALCVSGHGMFALADIGECGESSMTLLNGKCIRWPSWLSPPARRKVMETVQARLAKAQQTPRGSAGAGQGLCDPAEEMVVRPSICLVLTLCLLGPLQVALYLLALRVVGEEPPRYVFLGVFFVIISAAWISIAIGGIRSGRWRLTRDGLFRPRSDVLIPWSDVEVVGPGGLKLKSRPHVGLTEAIYSYDMRFKVTEWALRWGARVSQPRAG